MSEDRDQVGGVTIGAREIYDAVVALREDVRTLTHDHESVDQSLKDHEERIRGLERWRYAMPTSILLAVGSVVATVLKATGKI